MLIGGFSGFLAGACGSDDIYDYSSVIRFLDITTVLAFQENDY